MERLSGRNLTALASALIVLAAAAAVRVALTHAATAESRTPARQEVSADDRLARASAAENAGDVAQALANYREAILLRPGMVDRRSPEFLGAGFEGKIRGWISDLKEGRVRAAPSALEDASYIFRKMYGGCG